MMPVHPKPNATYRGRHYYPRPPNRMPYQALYQGRPRFPPRSLSNPNSMMHSPMQHRPMSYRSPMSGNGNQSSQNLRDVPSVFFKVDDGQMRGNGAGQPVRAPGHQGGNLMMQQRLGPQFHHMPRHSWYPPPLRQDAQYPRKQYCCHQISCNCDALRNPCL